MAKKIHAIMAFLNVALFAYDPAAAADRHPVETIEIASTFPLDLSLIGEGARRLAAEVERASGGELVLKLHEPGALVPAADTVGAVAEGRIGGAWAGAGWFAKVDPAFNMFSSVPFGPDTTEYLAWLYHGGGLELARGMFHAHGIHNIPCLLIPPEASGWFKKEIRSTADLKGLTMRFFGLGARVVEKLGVVTRQLPPGDIPKAFADGSIDAAEFSLPSIDRPLDLQKSAKYYYFPGWHQQATFFDLYIRLDRWNALPERHRAIVELACGDTLRDAIARGEAAQSRALVQMKREGVQLRRWAPDILVAFDKAWQEVVAEETRKSPRFETVYRSYTEFRSSYAVWKFLGSL